MKTLLAMSALGLVMIGGQAFGSTVTALNGTPYTASWHTLGANASGSQTITEDQPRSGNGSLRLGTPGSGGKAAATYGGNRFGGPNLGTFGDLLNGGSFGFDFYRDSSSTAAAHLAPAFEISFNNGAILKWEAVYNGYPVANPIDSDTWYTVNVTANSGLLWQFNGSVVTQSGSQQNLTLNGWLNASAGSDFTADTQITGISLQAGSGWAGSFVGFVDNAHLTLGSGEVVSANFEAIPLPAAAWLGMALLGGMGVVRKLRGKKQVA